VSEGLQGAMEANLALTEVAFQSDDKLAAKNLSGLTDAQELKRMRYSSIPFGVERPSMARRIQWRVLIEGYRLSSWR
jgi:hypothetical protein